MDPLWIIVGLLAAMLLFAVFAWLSLQFRADDIAARLNEIQHLARASEKRRIADLDRH